VSGPDRFERFDGLAKMRFFRQMYPTLIRLSEFGRSSYHETETSAAIEHLLESDPVDNRQEGPLYAQILSRSGLSPREMYEDAQTFFQKTLQLRPNLIEPTMSWGGLLVRRRSGQAKRAWKTVEGEQFNPWGRKCQEILASRSRGRSRRALGLRLAAAAEADPPWASRWPRDGGGVASHRRWPSGSPRPPTERRRSPGRGSLPDRPTALFSLPRGPRFSIR